MLINKNILNLPKNYINKMLINNKPNHKSILDISTLTKLNNPREARQLSWTS